MAKEHKNCWAHKGFHCVDCGVCTMNGEYYMVIDEVWKAVGMEPDGGMLCIGDLERRLGRELIARDFTDCPLNKQVAAGTWPSTARLLERIQRI